MNPLIREIKDQLLPAYSPDEAEALAWWVAEECTGLTRTQLLLNRLSTFNFQFSTIIARLLRHEPIQYIFGYTLWRGLRLSVTPATLIPRPETAELVDLVLNEISTINYQLSTVLDACTGSGCIAIALKEAHPEWQIDACDLSEEALQIARQNALDNGTDIRFFQHDLLSPFNYIRPRHQQSSLRASLGACGYGAARLGLRTRLCALRSRRRPAHLLPCLSSSAGTYTRRRDQ